MYLSLLFWLALALPGYAFVRRYWTDDLHSGLLGTISVSYLASLALLSPISILCYLLRAPVALFSIACVLLIVVAALDITLRKGWRPLGSLFLAAVGIELLIVLADVALGAWTGSFFGGDAKAHLGRIRFLLDRGFSNNDPSIAVPYFFPIYHTNLHHALFAACVQITRQDLFGVWFISLAWAKLLVVSGVYYLAWTVFDRHWPAWVAALACIGHRGPVSFLIYPNQLSPFWLAPLGLAFAMQACRRTTCDTSTSSPVPRSLFPVPFKLACVSLVLGQFHGLYVLFLAVVTAPLLIGGIATALWRRRRADALLRGICLASLAVGLPFILISKRGNTAAEALPAHLAAQIKDPEHYFISAESGGRVRDPANVLNLFGGGAWGTLAVAAGLIAGLMERRRREVAMLLVAPALVAIMLYTPPICSFLLHHAKEAWVLQRIEFIFPITFMVLCAPSIAYLVEYRFPAPRDAAKSFRSFWSLRSLSVHVLRGVVALGALFLAIPFAEQTHPWTWDRLKDDARLPYQERIKNVREIRELAGFLRESLPPGSTVLAALPMARDLIMLTDCFVISSASASNGVTDWVERRKDLILLLHKDTPWDQRRELFRKYDARYFFPTAAADWARGHVKRSWWHGKYLLCEMKIEDAPHAEAQRR
ncbi:MAG TPA: hypothetical protein VJZ71_18525 [Phycisphaerae bacterium]|nr:hypothetical protein [Phycisphaerae bacterium]